MPDALAAGPATHLFAFDLDGTLIDSRTDLANSVNATLTYLSRQPLPPEQIATYIGDGASALVQRSLQAAGTCTTETLQEAMPFFLNFYRRHNLDHTYVYEGVVDALTKIRLRWPGARMAVLTNKPVNPSRIICNGLGLTRFFSEIVGGDSYPSKKPDPTGLLGLIASAGAVDLAHTVLIGDSDVDVRTARAAGTCVVGCRYGFAPDSLAEARPDVVVDGPEDWVSAIASVLRSPVAAM